MKPPERFPPDDPREWINRARSNLIKGTNRVPGVYLEDLCFDAQQAADKAVKALLIARGVDFPYVHDLGLLLTLLEEAGEGLDRNFRKAAADEIERFRRERVQRTGDRADAENITEHDLLREVMNTVGKQGQLGDSIRCVVSVSMLTEGWDANTVTHVLGVRAFGTQLLCEQVIGRALRRQSYHANEQGLFDVEYADVLGTSGYETLP